MNSINLWVSSIDARQNCGYVLRKCEFTNIEDAQMYKNQFIQYYYIFDDEYTARIEMARLLLKFSRNSLKEIPVSENDIMYFNPQTEYAFKNIVLVDEEVPKIVEPLKIKISNMFFLLNEKLNQLCHG